MLANSNLGPIMKTRESTVAAIGETLIILQKVERFLAAVLMQMASSATDGTNLEKVLLRDKETLGNLLNYFKKRLDIPADFAGVLEALLQDRNVFVHSLFMQHWFDLNTSEGCARLEEFMQGIRNGARIATKVMMASLTPKETDAPRSPEVQAYIEHIFLRIDGTAHPNARARVTDQYIDKVREDALTNFTIGLREA